MEYKPGHGPALEVGRTLETCVKTIDFCLRNAFPASSAVDGLTYRFGSAFCWGRSHRQQQDSGHDRDPPRLL